ncbi:ScyD/ScyE family protein [Streptomyces sp. NPDC050085]|uniref:ScyD/ScyE family protein n=1 Tax=Streptomyces sp. NPDC050085 TaxID=3365600 RepID=UPI003788C051
MSVSSQGRRAVAATAGAAVAVGVALSAGPAVATPATPAGPAVEVLARGLDNPRQLAVDHGRLYVAEAGRGGRKCLPGGGPEGDTCIGTSAAVTKIYWEDGQRKRFRFVEGLPSAATKDGGFATGLDGVSVRDGRAWGVMTWAPPDQVPRGRPWNTLGKLLRLDWGRYQVAADIAAVELKHNPHRASVDSNPYAVLALPDGRTVVADAAGNDLIVVSPDGKAKPFTVFPNHNGHEAVPTSLALGPDGNLYVGDLNGEATRPTARVWKVSPRGRILGWTSGFGSITGLAVGGHGDLYVSQLFAGAVTRVDHGTGKRTSMKVPFPAGVAVDRRDGSVYVSAWSVADRDGTVMEGGKKSPGGQVWRITGF